jgi:dTDP-4-amino-4,6-dideoxygalactose transaminase
MSLPPRMRHSPRTENNFLKRDREQTLHIDGVHLVLLVSEPVIGEDEKAALIDVIDSNWITMGNQVRAFECAFAEKHGMADAVAVNSCTAGLHLALVALGIGPGDEVLVPSLSFVATANAVFYVGAKPVFVDIESLDSPLMSVADAITRCTVNTKAVIVMHYAGYTVDSDVWRAFAREHGLFLIEDSAHAVGAERSPIFGDLAAFSFFGNKNMTTAEGGMVTGQDETLIARVRQARGHGLTTSTVERLNGHALYDVTMLGYNYRMTELNAAIGLVQLNKLSGWNARRAQLTERYRKSLNGYEDTIRVPFASQSASTHHIFPVLLPTTAVREQVIGELRARGIQTSYHYPPIHHLSWYREQYPDLCLPVTEQFADRELTLPLHPKMEDWQVEFVTESLRSALGRQG